MISFSKTKQMKNCIRCFEFFHNSNNNFMLQSIFILNDLMKNMNKKKIKTSEPFGSALWLDLLPCRTFAVGSLQRHVRCLAYPATGHLQLVGCTLS
jgi:hypothetical protein